jgi:hypothetical protein
MTGPRFCLQAEKVQPRRNHPTEHTWKHAAKGSHASRVSLR